MLKKLSAVGVSCVTALVLMLSVFASPASVDAVTLEVMTSTAIECIISHEGTYNSINPNDCGAVSVGKLQWHADRALALMRKACEKNPSFAEATLGSAFYNEVMSATNWNYRTFSSSEAAAAAALLGSEYGIQAQDETAAADVQNYIISGQNMGLTDAAALVLFADIYNFGGGIASRIAKRAASYTGSYASVTLDDMYKAAMNDSYGSNSAFVSRTNKVYNYLVNKDWNASTVTTTTTTVTTPANSFSSDGAGTYIVNATSLNMRSGPGTGYSIVTQIPNGAEVTVTETNGSWAAVAYGSFNGYCSMDYLVKAEAATTAETTTTTTAVSTETTISADTTTTEETTAAVTTTTAETTATTTVTETTAATTTMSEETTTEATTTVATTEATSATTANAVMSDVIVNDSYATLYGDINCDGSVNVADAVLLQKFLSGSIQLNLKQIANSDCSYDGTLSAADIIVILQHLVGHYTALPIL